jgi:uncharacterized lipoprotein YbaY
MANNLTKEIQMNPLTIKAKKRCDISARIKRNDKGTFKAFAVVMAVLLLVSTVMGVI